MTGQPIELDKSILKVKVSFHLDTPSSCSEVTARFEQLVFERGWMMRLTSRKTHVIGVKNDGTLQQLSRMYSLRTGAALQLADRARSVLSTAAIIQVPDTRRILVIADESDHILFNELLEEANQTLTLILSPWLQLRQE
jgi:type II secretory pathway component GspD/PulD (secretin)